MKVFITNLPTSQDRRRFMEDQLRTTDVDYEFVECVIGKDLSEDEISTACDLRALEMNFPWMGRGMIGATMTSQRIYRQIIDRNLKCGMLLEDDTILPSNLNQILDQCEQFIQPGDVVLLFWLSRERLMLNREAAVDLGPVTLFQAPEDHRITAGAATIFSREAAERLLAHNTPIRMSPDCWRDFCDAGCISRLWCAYPPVIDTADFMSTMEGGPLVGLRKIVNRYKIFPLYQLFLFRRRRMKERGRSEIVK